MATKTAIWGHKQYAELNTLRSRINRNIMYVESLFTAANKAGYAGTTIKEINKSIERVEKEKKAAAAKKWNLSRVQFESLQAKAYRILDQFATGHSMGCFKVLMIGTRRFAEQDRTHNYAKSCTWKPTYGFISITLTKKELREIANIEGVWTIVNADGTAKWLESSGNKNTYKVQFVNGFVFGRSHSKRSLRDAQVIEGRKLQAEIQAMQDDKRFVGVQDIRKTGACDAGIKAFCERHGLNPEFGYNLGFLKSFNDSVGRSYLQRVQK